MIQHNPSLMAATNTSKRKRVNIPPMTKTRSRKCKPLITRNLNSCSEHQSWGLSTTKAELSQDLLKCSVDTCLQATVKSRNCFHQFLTSVPFNLVARGVDLTEKIHLQTPKTRKSSVGEETMHITIEP